MSKSFDSVTLIGMPGSGKSTVGVLLAKQLAMSFIDSDLLIQTSQHCTLQTIVDKQGYLALRTLEETVLLDMGINNTLIASGGSAVYSQSAMTRLKNAGPIIYISTPIDILLKRIDNMNSRGIAKNTQQSFEKLFEERVALYERYADITIQSQGKTAAEVMRAIQTSLNGR